MILVDLSTLYFEQEAKQNQEEEVRKAFCVLLPDAVCVTRRLLKTFSKVAP